jgi:hypothetical protein
MNFTDTFTDAIRGAVTPTRNTGAPSLGLAGLITRASHAVGFIDRNRTPHGEPNIVATPAAATASFRLMDAFPAPSAEQARSLSVDNYSTAGVTHTFSAAAQRASRVLAAGARLVHVADAVAADDSSTGFYKRKTHFSVITGAPFAVVADGADAVDSPLSVVKAEINLGDAPSHATSFRLSRKEIKAQSPEDLEYVIANSLALGLGQLIDRVLLQAVIAASPSAFTLAAAASRGLKFAELAAIAGTSMAGAAVGVDGVLRAAGIRAEMSDSMAETLVGCWSRAALACEQEVHLIAKRLNTVGDLDVVMHVNLQPLLPTGDLDFWAVA